MPFPAVPLVALILTLPPIQHSSISRSSPIVRYCCIVSRRPITLERLTILGGFLRVSLKGGSPSAIPQKGLLLWRISSLEGIFSVTTAGRRFLKRMENRKNAKMVSLFSIVTKFVLDEESIREALFFVYG